MTHRSINAVFFDWDRTLAYVDPAYDNMSVRLAHMFQLAGLPYSEKQMAAAMEQYTADAGHEQIKRFHAAQTRREIANNYAQLLDRLGHQDTGWELTLELYRNYAKLPWLLYEDSRATVQTLIDQGYIVAILSNHSHSARPMMEQMMGDLIPSRRIIISEEVGVHKPAKTIYRRAASRVRTPSENCFMVGDNFTADGLGAVNNGRFGHAVWLNRSQQENPVEPLPVNISAVTSLTQLSGLLETLN